MTHRLTAAELDAIRERESKATKGPWEMVGSSVCDWKQNDFTMEWMPNNATRPQDKVDAAFIAAARTDIPRLLDTIDAMQKDIDHLAAVIHEACNARRLRVGIHPFLWEALFQAEEEYHDR